MTPNELGARLSAEEFAEFAELFTMRAEEAKAAREEAKRNAEAKRG